MAEPENSAIPAKKKILSLDGGGVRGLSSLLILRHLMAELGNRLQPKRPNIKPCEYFDLIGGTSTGGIIAIMLGRLRMSVQECVDVYTILSKRIFGNKRSSLSARPLFYAEDLENVMKEVIRSKLGRQNQDAPLLDPLGDEACKTFVLSLQDQNIREPHRLRTYQSAGNVPCTIWQAARATSAAKTYFDSITFGNPPVEWVDAGLDHNNPAAEVLDEARFLWEQDDGGFDLKRQVGIFISLGTGIPDVFRPDKAKSMSKKIMDDIAKSFGVPPDVIRQMKDIVLNSEKQHEKLFPQFRGAGCEKVYHRYNVEGLGNIDLGDYEKEEIMTVDTNAYLVKRRFDIKDCAILMKQLSVYEPPLELFGEIPDEVVPSKEMLSQALKEENISRHEFDRSDQELSSKTALSFARLTMSWGELVRANVLDNRARAKLTMFLRSDMGNRARHSNDVTAVAKHVEVQMDVNNDLWRSYRLYVRVRRFARSKARSLEIPHATWDTSPRGEASRLARREAERVAADVKAWYCWCTHRIAGVSIYVGLLEDALDLYTEAWEERRDMRIWCERDIERSRDGMVKVQGLLKEKMQLDVEDEGKVDRTNSMPRNGGTSG